MLRKIRRANTFFHSQFLFLFFFLCIYLLLCEGLSFCHLIQHSHRKIAYRTATITTMHAIEYRKIRRSNKNLYGAKKKMGKILKVMVICLWRAIIYLYFICFMSKSMLACDVNPFHSKGIRNFTSKYYTQWEIILNDILQLNCLRCGMLDDFLCSIKNDPFSLLIALYSFWISWNYVIHVRAFFFS